MLKRYSDTDLTWDYDKEKWLKESNQLTYEDPYRFQIHPNDLKELVEFESPVWTKERYDQYKDFLVSSIAKELGHEIDERLNFLKQFDLKEYLFIQKMWNLAQDSYEKKEFNKAMDYLEYWYAHLSVQNLKMKERRP